MNDKPRVVAAGWIDDKGRVSGGWGRRPKVDDRPMKAAADERGRLELVCDHDHLGAVVTTDVPPRIVTISGEFTIVAGGFTPAACPRHHGTNIDHDELLRLLEALGDSRGRRALRMPWVGVALEPVDPHP